jgi:hypothetical protein
MTITLLSENRTFAKGSFEVKNPQLQKEDLEDFFV